MPRGSIDDQTELIKIYNLLNSFLAGYDTDLATIISNLGVLDRSVSSMDFWSAVQEEASIPAVAADVSLPSVTISLPLGVAIVRAQAMFAFRAAENINAAANKLSGAQYIQGSSNGMVGTWVNAIQFPDDAIGVAASSREGGGAFLGNSDIKAQIGAVSGTFYFKWAAALADQASLNFNDVQTGIRIWFR